jgi:hypothetical protein
MTRILAASLIGFCFLLLQCTDENVNPNYGSEPGISFKNLEFIQTPSLADSDTLKLTINYKDGDKDLGLDETFNEYPFNHAFYYLVNGASITDTVPLTVRTVYRSSPPFTLYSLLESLTSTSTPVGKLVTSKNYSSFNGFPTFNPTSCLNYSLTEVLVPASFNAVDNSYNILDTLKDQLGNDYYLVRGNLFYKSNTNNTNIKVTYYVLENGVFEEFDWFENFCINYNGRFPVLDGKGTFNAGPFKIKAKTPWEGEITYNMANSSFNTIFADKTLKLKIRIQDRALHRSNVIETPAFTLASVKK